MRSTSETSCRASRNTSNLGRWPDFTGHDIIVVKVKGPFVWHQHDDTDDFFLVLKGRITIQTRNGDVALSAGEMFVVPRGVEHCPVANDEAHLLLI